MVGPRQPIRGQYPKEATTVWLGESHGDEVPLRVKGGCGRQADGTTGLLPAPEMPLAFRDLCFGPEPQVIQLIASLLHEVDVSLFR
jgi:hypothetical protein